MMRRTRGAALAFIGLFVAGCAGRGTPSTVEPGVAAAAIERTAPDRPLRVIFAWEAHDGEARFTGRGAARIEPEYRARLDLFGPRGDGYLSAAVVGGELRLPAGVDRRAVPPPAMLWAVLGAVRPPEDGALVGTRARADRTELHYRADGAALVYELVDGRLRRARWEGDGRRMIVELEAPAEAGLPSSAVYRDWSAGTELMLNLEQVDEVEPYPPEIWTPGY